MIIVAKYILNQYLISYPDTIRMEHIEPTQFDKLLSSGASLIAMFYADWCPFCQRFKPIFEENVDQNTKSLKVYGCKLNER